MRRALILVPLLVALAAGCGGGKQVSESTTTPVSTTTAGSMTTTARVTVTTSGQTLSLPGGTAQCDEKQITAGERHEGSCVIYGVRVTFVNKAHWLHRREYDARLQGVRTATTLHTQSGGAIRPHGTFAVITLRIKSKLREDLAFDRHSNLVFLTVNKTIYDERHDAELDPSLNSFALRRTAIAPGGVATGTVVFDIPADQAEKISAATNNLILLNVADAGRSPQFPGKTQGYIRLWK